ncbi:MAG: 50S ribosomal protein L9 [Candidatus Paceibacterota bacterium]
MKVIMLKDVGGVGQRGKVIEVSDGYALNFLIAKGNAIQATPQKIADVEKTNAELAKNAAEKNAAMEQSIRALEGTSVDIKAKVNEKGHLFKKIMKEDVAKALFLSPDTIVDFQGPIKESGEHKIKIAFAGAKATVILKVDSN